MKINKSKWKEFNFNKLFLITRGKRLKTADQVSGDIAYISSTKTNNGIDNYVLPPDYIPIFNNAITLNNSGSIGYCFYHNYDFIASDHCTVLELKDGSLDSALFLFLKPIIEAMKHKYSFAREMSNDRLKKEKILLPAAKKDNRYIPDWKYMKLYINSKAKNITYNKSVKYPKKFINLDSVKWQVFKISELFSIIKGERLIEKDRGKGNVPLVTASSYNGGVTGFIEEDVFYEKKVLFKDKITVDMFGNVFYHKHHYFSDDNIHNLIFKDELNVNLSDYVNIFLITIIKKISSKYGFGRQVRLQRLKNETLSLPVDKNHKPNWQFMEDYIKSLPYSKSI